MTDQVQDVENAKDVAQPQTQQPEPEVKLVLKVSDVNLVLGALDELPHKITRKLIDSVLAQANAQLQPVPPVA
jgi:hypothetical protein